MNTSISICHSILKPQKLYIQHLTHRLLKLVDDDLNKSVIYRGKLFFINRTNKTVKCPKGLEQDFQELYTISLEYDENMSRLLNYIHEQQYKYHKKVSNPIKFFPESTYQLVEPDSQTSKPVCPVPQWVEGLVSTMLLLRTIHAVS